MSGDEKVMMQFDSNYILENGCFKTPVHFSKKLPKELVYIQAQRILSQFPVKKRITRNIALIPGKNVLRPVFRFKGVDNFNVSGIKAVSHACMPGNHDYKRLQLLIDIKYDLFYSDGMNRLVQPDNATFDITLNNVYLPDRNIKYYPESFADPSAGKTDKGGSAIEVEAMAQGFGEVISPYTGALILDIGVFFLIKFLRHTQLLVPSYGYFPARLKQ